MKIQETASSLLRRDCVTAWLLALILGVGMIAFQGDVGLNLSDEGYLWYGAWRVLEHEVPRVDFG